MNKIVYYSNGSLTHFWSCLLSTGIISSPLNSITYTCFTFIGFLSFLSYGSGKFKSSVKIKASEIITIIAAHVKRNGFIICSETKLMNQETPMTMQTTMCGQNNL